MLLAAGDIHSALWTDTSTYSPYFSQAFVADEMIGNALAGSATREIDVYKGSGRLGRGQYANYAWTNDPAGQPFLLQYDASSGTVSFFVGGTLSPAGMSLVGSTKVTHKAVWKDLRFSDSIFLTASSGVVGASIGVDDLAIYTPDLGSFVAAPAADGQSAAGATASGASQSQAFQLTGVDLRNGFVIRGTTTWNWGSTLPRLSALAVHIQVGTWHPPLVPVYLDAVPYGQIDYNSGTSLVDSIQLGALKTKSVVLTRDTSYSLVQRGTMDGLNSSYPNNYSGYSQDWESNRSVRLENIGTRDIVDPWLSNGQNNFRTVDDIVNQAVTPGMTDAQKAVAIWNLVTSHISHGIIESVTATEADDPVSVFNVYGYTLCDGSSLSSAKLFNAAGLQTRLAGTLAHTALEVYYDGQWHLLDSDNQIFALERDNTTVAGSNDLVDDGDLITRTDVHGVGYGTDEMNPEAGSYYVDKVLTTNVFPIDSDVPHTMNMVLRPGEAISWQWGHLSDHEFYGSDPWAGEIWVGNQGGAEHLCNGLWEYQPTLTKSSLWQNGAASFQNVVQTSKGLLAAPGQTGEVVWKMSLPYVIVGGSIKYTGQGVSFDYSADGQNWQQVGSDLSLKSLFPADGKATYSYYVRARFTGSLNQIWIANDFQSSQSALPGMHVGKNTFAYSDGSTGAVKLRVTHQWVERSDVQPPKAPRPVISPALGGPTGTAQPQFTWNVAPLSGSAAITMYEFQLSDRSDMRWTLSPAFDQFVRVSPGSMTASWSPNQAGLLNPGQNYYWRVRAVNQGDVWGPWSSPQRFRAGGLATPTGVSVTTDPQTGVATLNWQAVPGASSYRIYGSDQKGFSISDVPYNIVLAGSQQVTNPRPANFVAQIMGTSLDIAGAGINLVNADRSFYRVVAVDSAGHLSGASAYACPPRPFIYSQPVTTASVGSAYLYDVQTISSIGDLRQGRAAPGMAYSAGFWQYEHPLFALLAGPDWLSIDPGTGVLSGTPTQAGSYDVNVQVTIDVKSSFWGQPDRRIGQVDQDFSIEVTA